MSSTHDDDTCPHLVRASLLEAENARLKAKVELLHRAGDDLVLSVEWRNVVLSIPPTMSLIELASFLEVKEKCKCNLHNFDDDIKAWNAAKNATKAQLKKEMKRILKRAAKEGKPTK